MWTFFGQGKNGRKQPYIMYFARACVRTHILAYERERQKYMPNRYKKQQKRGKSCPEFFCTKAKNRKNARKMQETESPVHHKIRDYSMLHDK